ncbi:hypothetical protein DCAR_0728125 [Daucus carota subsp. sativus]|uniref:Uncharacterized protein n=1 Tax=Daucus carota subsp. sativus TaxID=79200 RepID=A0AAF0XJ37_DAUCS|nr:hypothetical protein DCAR_0728125 [Daucus carota subsp. sativus]
MVERSLSMREVRGSIPRISIFFFFQTFQGKFMFCFVLFVPRVSSIRFQMLFIG